MASYADGMIPLTWVSITDVRQTLGLPNTAQWNDVFCLCTCENINKWSSFKPISVSKDELTDAERAWESGFRLIRYPHSSMGDSPVLLTYIKPYGTAASPCRLADFRGYKHKSKKPELSIDSNIVVGASDVGKPVRFTARVTLPDIPIGKLVPGAHYLTIESIETGGDNPLGRGQVGKIDISSDDGGASLAGKTIEIPCVEVRNVPGNGTSVRNRYIPKIDTYFFDLITVLSQDVTMTGQSTPDPNEPRQWQDCKILDPENLVKNGACRWNKWEHWFYDGKLPDSRIRITGLRKSQNVRIELEYYNQYMSRWVYYGDLVDRDMDFTVRGLSNISDWRITSTLT